MTHRSSGVWKDLKHFSFGLLMGGADIIPGVSGGTVALILGIYQRLVTAISHFDLTLLGYLRRQEWIHSATHVDLRFLITLGVGILTGVAGLASLMNHLLTNYGVPTWSFLFGLILASSILVGLMVDGWKTTSGFALLAAAAFAYGLVGLLPASPPEHYWYVFLCGMVAICAMILPGISGAFILVLMGMYVPITGIIKGLPRGDFSIEGLITVCVFVSGCAIGLLGFSKVLRWLLAHHKSVTMSVLSGFMLGSLRKIWPFKKDVTLENLATLQLPKEELEDLLAHPDIEKVDMKHRLFENTLPTEFDGEVAFSILLAIAGVGLVFGLNRATRKPR